MIEAIKNLWETTGLFQFESTELMIKTLIMYVIVGVLVYLAVVKGFEPLLLLPIATGMLLANLPGANLFHMEWFVDGVPVMRDGIEVMSTKLSDVVSYAVGNGGLLDILYLGVKLGIYPSLIFLGVGAMTDFSPLISNPKSIFLGGAAQLGVFMAFFGALLFGFSPQVASAIGIIGGADGPTAILVTKILAPEYLGPIAIAAYSYMALIPMIQPPIMKLMTTKKERSVVMTTLRPVSKKELVIFPIMVIIVVCLMLPDAAPLIGFLMFGNLLNVSGVTDRLSKTAQNELINIVTIFLGISVGATASAKTFLDAKTLLIIALGLVAFCFSTFGGLLGGKIMYLLSGGKVNPLIGSAGVSAVPMAARVSQKVGQEEVPGNFLLMHAMGPNVAGVIGSAIAAGVFLALYQVK
ncbi:sodium ion-translocating decarboxylase beta subunit [Candidatus Apopatosoma intestinale]|nr:sodium ion-translocating decarboxylase beta subunit [Candidatus Apopatosoma intestinale]